MLAHEVAHLFWGSGVRFKESVLTEGVAEYMSIKYLESKNENEILKSLLNRKRHRVEGIRDADLVSRKLDKKLVKKIGYEFSPLLFLYNEKNNSDLYNNLSHFFKTKIGKDYYVSLAEIQDFFKRKKSKKLDSGILPDFYITETKNEIIINGLTFEDVKIDLEKTLSDGSKEKHTLPFSLNKNKYSFSKKNIVNIVIDPNYKILQYSRLNDVWIKNNKSYSSKNRYFNLEDIPPKALAISNEILNFLETEDNLILDNLTCESNSSLRNSYINLKNKIYKNENEGIIITGASTFQRKNSKYIYIKLVYFSKNENKSKVLSFKLEIDKEQEFIQKLQISKTY